MEPTKLTKLGGGFEFWLHLFLFTFVWFLNKFVQMKSELSFFTVQILS